MTGFTSSSKSTRSPITMASTPGLPGVKAAHDVSPRNGATFEPSTATGTSVRGKETFTTPSELSGLPPVAAATAPSSMAGDLDAGRAVPAAGSGTTADEALAEGTGLEAVAIGGGSPVGADAPGKPAFDAQQAPATSARWQS